MPTYQYACTQCPHTFEQVQSFSDDPLAQCPQCQGRLRKVYSGVGVVFKGSGFYRTDSRDSGKGTRSGADKDGAGKEGSSTDSASKDSGAKQNSGKDSSGKDSSGKDSATSSGGQMAKNGGLSGGSSSGTGSSASKPSSTTSTAA